MFIMYRILIICYVSVVWLVTLNVAAVTDAQKSAIQTKLLASGIDCIASNPITLSDIEAFKNKMMPDNKNAKCFTKCMFKKIGFMDDMGKLSAMGARDVAKEIFKGNDDYLKKVDSIMGACSSVKDQPISGDDKDCDQAKLAFNCLSDNAHKHGLDINF